MSRLHPPSPVVNPSGHLPSWALTVISLPSASGIGISDDPKMGMQRVSTGIVPIGQEPQHEPLKNVVPNGQSSKSHGDLSASLVQPPLEKLHPFGHGAGFALAFSTKFPVANITKTAIKTTPSNNSPIINTGSMYIYIFANI